MRRSFLLPLLLLVVSHAPAIAAVDDGLRRCAAVVEAAPRLACYDALARTLPGAVPAAPAAAATSATPATPSTPTEAAFGLAPTPQTQLDAVVSRIVGAFEGWGPNTRLQLANGQVWQIVDGSSVYQVLREPKVTVRRAALGSFRLDIEGVNQSPRVRRVQ